MKRASSPWSRRPLILGALGGLCLAAALLPLLVAQRPVPFVVLAQPCSLPMPLRERIDRLVPNGAGWAWRLEQAVFGPRKTVTLSADIVTLPHAFKPPGSGLALGAPNFSDPSGIQVWLLGAQELKPLHQLFTQAPENDLHFRPRIGTADGIQAALFQGQSVALAGSTNQVGLSLTCFPRLRPDSTDLIAAIRLSELVTNRAATPGSTSAGALSIRTNLDTAFRLGIPRGKGVFVLAGQPTDPGAKQIALILDPP